MPPRKPKDSQDTAPSPKPIDSGVLRESRGAFRAGNRAGIRHGIYAEYTVQPEEQEAFLEFRQALADQFSEELGVDGILLDAVALQFVHHSRCMRLGHYAAVQLIQPLINPWLDRLKITKKDREQGQKKKQRGILELFSDVLGPEPSDAASDAAVDEAAASASARMRAVPPPAAPPPNPGAPATPDRIAVIREQVQRDAALKNGIKVSHNTGAPAKKPRKTDVLF